MNCPYLKPGDVGLYGADLPCSPVLLPVLLDPAGGISGGGCA
jgi:hypothetical protein